MHFVYLFSSSALLIFLSRCVLTVQEALQPQGLIRTEKSYQKHVRHIGQYFVNTNTSFFGHTTNVLTNPQSMEDFATFIVSGRFDYGEVTDRESLDLIRNYFWGIKEGIVLELGSFDGATFSESMPLHHYLGWHRILIEANPYYSSKFSKVSPDAFCVSAAICSQKKQVHYKWHKDLFWATVGGILEFMSEEFVAKFHPDLKGVPKSNWTNIPTVSPVYCLPLSTILKETQVQHINAFILDVEGAELDVLRTINYKKVTFDVICVETDLQFRSDVLVSELTDYLRKHDYILHMKKGRNSWFVHKSFHPSSLSTSNARK